MDHNTHHVCVHVCVHVSSKHSCFQELLAQCELFACLPHSSELVVLGDVIQMATLYDTMIKA